MAIPADKTNSDFTFRHSLQVDAFGPWRGDYNLVQSDFDSRSEDMLGWQNALKAGLRASLGGILEYATTGTATIDADTIGFLLITSLAEALTMANPTGTPVFGRGLFMAIKDNGTPQVITWNSSWFGMGLVLPVITEAGKWMYFGAKWNSSSNKYHVLAKTIEP